MTEQNLQGENLNKTGKSTKIPLWIYIIIGVVIIVLFLLTYYLMHFDRPFGMTEVFWYLIGDTTFSKGYSEKTFQSIQTNMSSEEVKKLLGEPIRKYRNDADRWIYEDTDGSDVLLVFRYQGYDDQLCSFIKDDNMIQSDFLRNCEGKKQSEILKELGEPKKKIEDKWFQETWAYTYSPGDTHFIRRYVAFDRNGRVLYKTADCYFD